MSRRKSVWLIAMREVRERTRSRVFRIGTVMTILIVVAAIVFPAIAKTHQAKPSYAVGVVGDISPDLQTAITKLGPSVGGDISVAIYSHEATAQDALQQDLISAILIPGDKIIVHTGIDPDVPTPVSQLVGGINNLTRLYDGFENMGLLPYQIDTALHTADLPVTSLEPPVHRNSHGASAAGGGMVLLFVFLTLYGAFILNSVIEEKTSRVVEILLSTVRVNELLLGKVVGTGIVGTLQGVVLVIATLLARSATPGSSASTLTPQVVIYTLLWFALGFGMFAWLYACAGALVSRTEDAQNLVFPLQIPLVASYAVGLVSTINGPNTVLNVMSMFPLTAPMTMLERMSAQQVPWWQVVVSIALCLLTIWFVMRLAVTIFAGGILRSGQRVKLLDAWRNPAG